MVESTSLWKLLIVIVAATALLFGVINFFNKDIGVDNNIAVPTQRNNTSSNNTHNSQVDSSQDKVQNTSTFNYTPPSIKKGKLLGVIELGASGFNSFIIKKDKKHRWQKEKYEWGNSLVMDGIATEGNILVVLKRYIGNILDYGVDSKDIHFVVSSGANEQPIIQPIIAAIQNLGYHINVVTPEAEARYALRAVLPKPYEDTSFVVDLGSHDTKIAWKENGRYIQTKDIAGAKYFKKERSDSDVYAEAVQIGSSILKQNTKTCFIIGGAPFLMAKATRKGNERYTVLSKPNSYMNLAKKEGKKLQCGLNIYKGLYDGSECTEFVFDWNANFTIGFLLSLPD